MQRQVGLMLIGALWIATLPPGQESVVVARLQQEVGQLRFELDSRTDRLGREVEQLRLRLNELQYAPKPALPSVAPPARQPTAVVDPGGDTVSRRLVIEDSQGAPRIVLTVSDRFGPMVALLNDAGDVEVMLASGPDGAGLDLFDTSGRRIGRFPEEGTARAPR